MSNACYLVLPVFAHRDTITLLYSAIQPSIASNSHSNFMCFTFARCVQFKEKRIRYSPYCYNTNRNNHLSPNCKQSSQNAFVILEEVHRELPTKTFNPKCNPSICLIECYNSGNIPIRTINLICIDGIVDLLGGWWFMVC